MVTLLLRGQVHVTTAEGCACDYDERLGIGWTCDACLDTAAVPVDLTDL